MAGARQPDTAGFGSLVTYRMPPPRCQEHRKLGSRSREGTEGVGPLLVSSVSVLRFLIAEVGGETGR